MTEGQSNPPGRATEGTGKAFAGAEVSLTDWADQFTRRALQDALAEATADYWLRRAQVFEDCRRRPGDFIGRNTTPESRAAKDAELADLAEACRAKAVIMADPSLWDDDMRAVLGIGDAA